MGEALLYVKRQDALMVYRLAPGDDWFWTGCYRQAVPLIGRTLRKGEEIVLHVDVRELEEGSMSDSALSYLVGSKKSKMGHLWLLTSGLLAFFSTQLPISTVILAAFILGGALVVAAHLIAYGLTDAAAAGKK